MQEMTDSSKNKKSTTFATQHSCMQCAKRCFTWCMPGMMMPTISSVMLASPASIAAARIFCIRTWPEMKVQMQVVQVVQVQ